MIYMLATDNIMLSSTIGRNKSLINGQVLAEIINGTEELLAEYKNYGINIIYIRSKAKR